jgi:hypothetical protein
MIKNRRLLNFVLARTRLLVLATFSLVQPSSQTDGVVLATPPSITQQPQSQPVCNSGNPYVGRASFTCYATGTQPLIFRWRRGTTELVNGGNIAGATTYNLVIQPAASSDAASDYNCVVTNDDGSINSNNASLIVFPTGTGDVNGDGTVNGRDVRDFINVSLGFPPQMGTAPFCAADMDGNGGLACEDLCVFVQLLLESPLGCGNPPQNDDCPSALLITTGVVFQESTSFASRDGPPISCEAGCSPACNTAPDVWFKWVANFTGQAYFTMCDNCLAYDAVMALYDACPTMGGVQLTCGDDGCPGCHSAGPSVCNWGVVAGQTYWVRISGWAGAKGCFSIRVSPSP